MSIWGYFMTLRKKVWIILKSCLQIKIQIKYVMSIHPGDTSPSLELFFCATEHSPVCPMAQVYSVIEALTSASW